MGLLSKAKMGMRVAGALARRPSDFGRWLAEFPNPRSPVDLRLPWISWGAIDYLRANVKPGSKVLEFGGGGSTLFFLDQGCEVTTVEHDGEWADTVVKLAGDAPLTMLHRPVSCPITQLTPLEEAYIQAGRGSQYDVILVDGVGGDVPMRMLCLEQSRSLISKNGIVLLDDADRSEYSQAGEIMRGCSRRIFGGVGPGKRRFARTDGFFPTSR